MAKWKTAAQMLALCLLLIGLEQPLSASIQVSPMEIGSALLWIAAGVTAFTGYDYLRVAMRHILAPDAAAASRE